MGKPHATWHVEQPIWKAILGTFLNLQMICVYSLLVHFKFDYIDTAHSITVFLGYFYISANPFIYVLKFHPVRRILLGLIPWNKSQQASKSVEMSPAAAAKSRAT